MAKTLWPFCRRGHNKEEVGTVGPNKVCRICHNENTRRRRALHGALPRESGVKAPGSILRARRLLGLSATEVARRIESHPNHYMAVEKGRKLTTPRYLNRVLGVLVSEARFQGIEKLPDYPGTPPKSWRDPFGYPTRIGVIPSRRKALAVLRRTPEKEWSAHEMSVMIRRDPGTTSTALKDCFDAGFATRRRADTNRIQYLYRATTGITEKSF